MSRHFKSSKRTIEKYKIDARKEKRKQRELIGDLYVLAIIYLIKEKEEKKKDEKRRLKFESRIERIIKKSKGTEIIISPNEIYDLHLCGYLRKPRIDKKSSSLEGVCAIRSHYKTKKCNGPDYDMAKCRVYHKMEERSRNHLEILGYLPK